MWDELFRLVSISTDTTLINITSIYLCNYRFPKWCVVHSEIPHFLSDDECNRLVKVASSHVMQNSDIQPDTNLGNHDYHTSFGDWDRNGDRLIDQNEVCIHTYIHSLMYLPICCFCCCITMTTHPHH